MPRHDTAMGYEYRLNRILDALCADMSREWTLADMAEVAHLSPFHLHRVLSALLGESPAALIRRLRLESAAMALRHQPGRSITSIALEYGFSSSQNFARAFKVWQGMSPGLFREQCMRGLKPLFPEQFPRPEEAPYILQYEEKNGRPRGRYTLNPALAAKGKAMHVELKQMPARTLVYARHMGPYGPDLGPSWDRIMSWAGKNGLIRPGVEFLGISWDDPAVTPAAQLRYDACVTLPDGVAADEGDLQKSGLASSALPAGLCACYKKQVKPDGYGPAWRELFGVWLPQSGYECCGVPYELYLDVDRHMPAEGQEECNPEMSVIFCLPVRRPQS